MPSEGAEHRKLAAIMFTDMVGYSALAQRDDQLALELLEEHRRLLREIFPRFNGTEIKTIGDAFLIEFSSALEAAQCAIEIQRTLAKRNHDVTLDRRIELKIGIHIGDVVHRGGDVYGDGVNIASRIEQLAGAGGICVSMDVERQIRNALETRLEKLAPIELKNISVPMDLFRIVLPWEQRAKTEFKNAETSASRRSVLGSPLVWVGAIVLVVIGFGWWWVDHPSGRATKSSNSISIVPPTDKKSIAVLPFVDLSQAKDQEYFCDGISEEILDALAKIEGLRVVARTSSFSFKGKNSDVAEIAQKLNVGNVLEGSLRREGNRIRITAQLVSAANGSHLWSETYERELQGVFAVQDEITRAIVDALKINLAIAPAVQSQRNTEAHDLYLQGLYFSNKSTEEGLRKSLDFFQRSLEKDPNSARPWAGIAKVWDWLADAYMKPLDAYPKMRAAALKAVSLNDRDAEGHVYLAEAKRVLDWDVAAADAELERALQLDPNSADAHFYLALNRLAEGKPEEAVAQMRAAVKADPLSPVISNFFSLVYLNSDRFDDAVLEAKRTQELDPDYLYEFPILAEAYRQKEMFAEAIELYKKAQEKNGAPQPGLAITYAQIGRQAEARRILDDLKKIAATKYIPAEEIAAVCVALGDKEEAFEWLERAYREHSGPIHAIATRKVFRPLHSDPRFAAILKRIGLDPGKVLVNERKL